MSFRLTGSVPGAYIKAPLPDSLFLIMFSKLKATYRIPEHRIRYCSFVCVIHYLFGDADMFKINETTKAYTTTRPVSAEEIVATALDLLAVRLPHTDALTSPDVVRKYLVTLVCRPRI